MSSKPFDGVKNAISVITETLGINEAYLAGVLDVSEKSLNDWKKLGVGELTPKAKRLKRLYEVIEYIRGNYTSIAKAEIKSVLENGRITIDPNDEDDGSTALISFILAEPKSMVWVSAVKEAIEDYLSSKPKPRGERVVETHRAV